MEDTLHQYVAVAPVFYPDADGFMDVSYANFEMIKVFEEASDLQYQIYGPKFDERVDDLCSKVTFIDRA